MKKAMNLLLAALAPLLASIASATTPSATLWQWDCKFTDQFGYPMHVSEWATEAAAQSACRSYCQQWYTMMPSCAPTDASSCILDRVLVCADAVAVKD